MFGINIQDLAEPKRTMEHFQEWAGEIANSYFSAGVEPTTTLQKIATVEELTPHQIEVLAGEANKLIHQKKFASMDEKYFAADFPLADSKIALKNLQLDGGKVKVAAATQEPIVPDLGPDAYSMFGVNPEELSKTAEVKHNLKTAEEKLELLKQKIEDQLIFAKHAKIINEKAFIKEARQHLLDESNSQARATVLGKFASFVDSSELPVGREVLAKLTVLMKKEGKLEPTVADKATAWFLRKEADQKAPEELISGTLPAQIVNGQHPLYIILKTLQGNEADILRYERDCALVDDKLRILKQKIRAL
jgi:hypothetical protein